MKPEWTHVVTAKGDWYLIVFFEIEKSYEVHGPLVKGALTHCGSGKATSLQDAYKDVEAELKKAGR